MTAIEAIRTELDKARQAVTAFEQALAILEGHEPPAPHPALPVPKADAPRPRGTGARKPGEISITDRILIALADGPLTADQVCEKTGLLYSQVQPRFQQLKHFLVEPTTPGIRGSSYQLTEAGLARAKRAAQISH